MRGVLGGVVVEAGTQCGAAVEGLLSFEDFRQWGGGDAARLKSARKRRVFWWVGGVGRDVDLLRVCVSLAVHFCWMWSHMEVGYRRDMVVGFRRVVVGVRWIACLEKRWRWRWRVGWWMARSWGVGDGVVVVILWWRWVTLLWGNFVMFLTDVLNNIFTLLCEPSVLLQSEKKYLELKR